MFNPFKLDIIFFHSHITSFHVLFLKMNLVDHFLYIFLDQLQILTALQNLSPAKGIP